MELILYVIFVFTLLLIVFSINEYYESCQILSCQKDYGLTGTGKDSKCTKCEVQHALTYATNTCNPTTCSGLFYPSGNSCAAYAGNAKNYDNNGKITECNIGYYPAENKESCIKCQNTTNVFTYDTIANNTCNIKQCKPGYSVAGTGINQNCNTECTNSKIGVDFNTKNDLGYISAYDQPTSTEKTNVPV